MEAILAEVASAARVHLEQLPASVAEFDQYIRTTYESTSVSEAQSRLSANGDAVVAPLVLAAEERLLGTIEVLSCIERWISLSEPKLEDGNNFGVDASIPPEPPSHAARAPLPRRRRRG